MAVQITLETTLIKFFGEFDLIDVLVVATLPPLYLTKQGEDDYEDVTTVIGQDHPYRYRRC